MFVRLYFEYVLKKNPIILFKNLFPPPVNSNVYFSQSSPKQNEKNLDNEIIRQLETLSLVNFESKEHIRVVEDAIKFADNIHSLDTDNVEPLISVLENETLKLREDVITDGNCRKEILLNAAAVEEDYFVAPPGNIPVDYKPFRDTPAEPNHEQSSG